MSARRVRERPRPPVGEPPLLLLDTNVLLDVILDREPWVREAALLLDSIAKGLARGAIAGHALTTVHYIVERARGRTSAVTAMSDLLELLEVVPLDRNDFQRALALGLRDFEDAVQAAACLSAGAEMLVTRNASDFKGSPVATRSPAEARAAIEARR